MDNIAQNSPEHAISSEKFIFSGERAGPSPDVSPGGKGVIPLPTRPNQASGSPSASPIIPAKFTPMC